MKKVTFFNGSDKRIEGILLNTMPEGFEVACQPSKLASAEKIKLIRDAEFLILYPAALDGEILREAESLRLIQLLTAGYDRMDLKLCAELGIPVATNGGANAWSVAEHSIALLLALYKRLLYCDQSVRAGTWRKPVTSFNTYEVAGKIVGILGAGNIGCKVAKRLKAFETEVIYYDAFPSAVLENDIGARKASLDEVVAKADIISIHLPFIPDTRSLIGSREFALMKPTAVIINTSRAEIIEENALVAALREKRILGAGLDVFHQEPVVTGHPLLSLENVILSPHSAGQGCEGWNRRTDFAWKNIQRVVNGEKPASLAGSLLT